MQPQVADVQPMASSGGVSVRLYWIHTNEQVVDIRMELAGNLKRKREECRMSQDDVASKLNISRQSISKWETGKCYPDLDNLILLSDLYKISLDELIKGDKSFQERIIIRETGNVRSMWPWWVIFPAFGMLYGLVSMILNRF